MTRRHAAIATVALLTLAPALAGCAEPPRAGTVTDVEFEGGSLGQNGECDVTITGPDEDGKQAEAEWEIETSRAECTSIQRGSTWSAPAGAELDD